MMYFLFKNSFWKIFVEKRWIFALFSLGLCLWGLKMVFFDISPDYLQGDLVRILFIHVPFAWLSMLIYAGISVCAFIFLVFKLPLAFQFVHIGAPIGRLFTLLTIITGSIWGKATWGTWWAWDARLTSVLILFFIYLGFEVLKSSLKETQKSQKILSYYILLGTFNLPIIKFSVDWWNTLHQPATISKDVFKHMDPSYFLPLLIMFLAFLSWAFFLLLLKLLKREK